MCAAIPRTAFATGEFLRRADLPRLTAYLLVGMALGDSGFGRIDADLLREIHHKTRCLNDVALAQAQPRSGESVA